MVRLSKLLRSYVADLLTTGISDSYNIGIKITPDAENAVLEMCIRDRLTASFRFHLTVDTLAVRLYISHYLGMFGTYTR